MNYKVERFHPKHPSQQEADAFNISVLKERSTSNFLTPDCVPGNKGSAGASYLQVDGLWTLPVPWLPGHCFCLLLK